MGMDRRNGGVFQEIELEGNTVFVSDVTCEEMEAQDSLEVEGNLWCHGTLESDDRVRVRDNCSIGSAELSGSLTVGETGKLTS